MSWSPADYRSLIAASKQIGCNPADLLACMFFESGLNPQAQNPGGAYGLIQWTPVAYSMSGFRSRQDIPSTVQGQMPHVVQYFQSVKQSRAATFDNAGDVYQAIFAPGFFPAKSNSTTWYDSSRNPEAYAQNRALDSAGKGYITRGDAVSKVAAATRTAAFRQALTELQAVAGAGYEPSFGPGLAAYEPGPGQPKFAAVESSIPALLFAGSAFAYYWFRLRRRSG